LYDFLLILHIIWSEKHDRQMNGCDGHVQQNVVTFFVLFNASLKHKHIFL